MINVWRHVNCCLRHGTHYLFLIFLARLLNPDQRWLGGLESRGAQSFCPASVGRWMWACLPALAARLSGSSTLNPQQLLLIAETFSLFWKTYSQHGRQEKPVEVRVWNCDVDVCRVCCAFVHFDAVRAWYSDAFSRSVSPFSVCVPVLE